MKKSFLYVAVLALCATAFVSCEPNTQMTDGTKVWPAFNPMENVAISISRYICSTLYLWRSSCFRADWVVLKEVLTLIRLLMPRWYKNHYTFERLGESILGRYVFRETRELNWDLETRRASAIAAIYENVYDFSNGAAIFVNSMINMALLTNQTR